MGIRHSDRQRKKDNKKERHVRWGRVWLHGGSGIYVYILVHVYTYIHIHLHICVLKRHLYIYIYMACWVPLNGTPSWRRPHKNGRNIEHLYLHSIYKYINCTNILSSREPHLLTMVCPMRVAWRCVFKVGRIWCVLQCAAVCCSVLQRIAACCSVLRCVTVFCIVLQSVAICSLVYVWRCMFKSTHIRQILWKLWAILHYAARACVSAMSESKDMTWVSLGMTPSQIVTKNNRDLCYTFTWVLV